MSRERVENSSQPRQDAINFVSNGGKHNLVFGKWLDAGPPNGRAPEPCYNSNVHNRRSLIVPHISFLLSSSISTICLLKFPEIKTILTTYSPNRSSPMQGQRKDSPAMLPKRAKASPSGMIMTSSTLDPVEKVTTSMRSWEKRLLLLRGSIPRPSTMIVHR